MMKILRNKHFLFFLGCIFLAGLWFIISTLVDINSMVFPSPGKVFMYMLNLLKKKETYNYLAFSIHRLLIGFLISFVLAFILGLVVNDNKEVYNFFVPIITFLKAAPTATFVFLFIVLVGGKNSPIFVVITVTFPILYESIVSAFRTTSKATIEAAKLDGAGKLQRLIYIQIPQGISFIILGVVSTFGMAFKIEIMAEVITGITNGGIGTMINVSQLLNATDLTPMFAYSLIAIILVLLITFLTSILRNKLQSPKQIKHRDMYKN